MNSGLRGEVFYSFTTKLFYATHEARIGLTLTKGPSLFPALKEQLDQVNTFVTGLKEYTDGVAQASDGAATLSAGAMLVSAGASTLQETGTKMLKDSILTAEKSAAEKLLPLMEKDLAGALNAWKTTKDQLTDTGYDLKPEGMDEETVYIIRTDLK